MMYTGEIVEGRGGLYTVRDEQGQQHVLRARGKFRLDGMTPLPGDQVRFSPRQGEEHGWVEEILPRVSLCPRPPVANIRIMLIVVAQEPLPDWLLVDKLLLMARMQLITPVMAVNKCDLGQDTLRAAQAAYARADVPVLAASAYAGQGMEAIGEHLSGGLSCLAGQSGVGKSALLSALLGVDLVSGAISHRTRRGRQTTRHTTLLYKDGLKVLDTPGFSLLDLPRDMPPEDLAQHYPEITTYGHLCRFQPCLHRGEPGCAVLKAERDGHLHPERMGRYRELLQQLDTAWRERYD